MSFPINPNIPASGNNPSNDQPLMQANFANINGFLGVDHTAPGTGAAGQAGQHNQVTFTLNQSAPSIANGVSGLYANMVSSLSQLFFQNSSGSIPLTGLPIVNSGGNFGVRTPWGLILNWGNVGGVSTGGTPITFAVPFTHAQSFIATGVNSVAINSVITQTGLGPTGVTVYTSQAGGLFYFAIGT